MQSGLKAGEDADPDAGTKEEGVDTQPSGVSGNGRAYRIVSEYRLTPGRHR